MLEEVPLQKIDFDKFDRNIQSRDELKEYLHWLVDIGVDINVFKEEANAITTLESDLEYFDQRLNEHDFETNEDFKKFCDEVLFKFYDDINEAGKGAELLHEKFEEHRQNKGHGRNINETEMAKYLIYKSVNTFLLGTLFPQTLLNLDKEEREVESYLDASILHLNHKSNDMPQHPNFEAILEICSFYTSSDEKREELNKLKWDLKQYTE